MIARSKTHLRDAGEGYWQHFRFASTLGLLAIAAGVAALLHAVLPAVCTTTASRIVRHIGHLLDHRNEIEEIESETIEAKAFALLLILATVVVAPLWVLEAPAALRVLYTMLAYALPISLMVSNPDLELTPEPQT